MCSSLTATSGVVAVVGRSGDTPATPDAGPLAAEPPPLALDSRSHSAWTRDMLVVADSNLLHLVSLSAHSGPESLGVIEVPSWVSDVTWIDADRMLVQMYEEDEGMTAAIVTQQGVSLLELPTPWPAAAPRPSWPPGVEVERVAHPNRPEFAVPVEGEVLHPLWSRLVVRVKCVANLLRHEV